MLERDGWPPQAQMYSPVKMITLLTQSQFDLTIQHEQFPIMALPVVPQLTPNDNLIIPIIPTDPLFPLEQWPQRPFQFGRRHYGSREGNMIC